jgi:S-adenosylmethionine:tRNA ribosyltransferase-isomerase
VKASNSYFKDRKRCLLNEYQLKDYEYHLPQELIAQEPLEQRDSSRMLVLDRQDQSIRHDRFNNFTTFLNSGDLLVLNNTKVIPARLNGSIEKSGTPAEILLINRLENGNWEAMVKPGRKLKTGTIVSFDFGVQAVIEGLAGDGLREISFSAAEDFEKILPRLGKVPLPPYIKKEVKNPEQYQTIYAREEGSAAAPTAGFHFTDQVFVELEAKGVQKAFITLHIGPGTFQPVKVEDIREHQMHHEYFRISNETAGLLNSAQAEGRRIIAVGTTVCRVLETIASGGKHFAETEGWTELYIYPGFQFKAVDALLTNFHLPRSSLLLLVSALAGRELMLKAYSAAVEQRYRFFSFGDCMLII